MSTPLRVAAFAAALAAAFLLAFAAGRGVGPLASGPASPGHGEGGHEDAAVHAESTSALLRPPGGLMTTADGYTLRIADPWVGPGPRVPVSFTIEGPDGIPVTAYDVEHERRLHLVAVRRDQAGFQHVHPRLDSTGTWHARLSLKPGDWRLFADFTPAGHDRLVLGADLAVEGPFRPQEPSSESRTAEVDGYTVALDGALVAGREAELAFTVTRDGEPVTDLQPYLGAAGHLVALRDADLAYLHVHPHSPPSGTAGIGPEVSFKAAVPSPGGYHLYLDFKHGSVVRTAAFVVSGGSGEH